MADALAGLTVFGHRGAAGLAPENTLAGFDAGIKAGADWLEFDVQHHAGALLLFHDARLERRSNGRGRLVDHDLAHLRSLDVGAGQRMPLLEEALDHLAGRTRLNIEMKSFGDTAAALARLLVARIGTGQWSPEHLLVSSFHLPELARFRELAPAVPIAPLYVGPPRTLCAEARRLAAVAVHLDHEFVDAAMIDDAHRSGLRVHVYTVNEPADARRLRALGVDGIFTDYPDRFRKN